MQNAHERENSYVMRQITRINARGRQVVDDLVLKEETYSVFCNEKKIADLHCLPFFLEQLAVGYLFCRSHLQTRDDITQVGIDKASRTVRVDLESSPAAKQWNGEGEICLARVDIHRLQENFNDRCELFRKTGAAHSCALADSNGILVFMEDIARHNALDKVIGEMILSGISPAGKALIFSGRLAFDMLEKTTRSGVKLLIAPGAPSLAAVEQAEQNQLTLLGFVRRDNMNIYTHPHRVT